MENILKKMEELKSSVDFIEERHFKADDLLIQTLRLCRNAFPIVDKIIEAYERIEKHYSTE